MALCSCCSGEEFDNCCSPIISEEQPSSSPLVLMRSRYAAYQLENYAYIYKTYASESQKGLSISELQQASEGTHWIKLIIHAAPPPQTDHGNVEFSAFYLLDNDLYEMREKSNFIVESNHWRYLDGEIICHEKIRTLKRNDPCPCDSGKKFKKCCSN